MSTFKAEDGNFITQGLFLELCYHDPKHAIYTIKREDHEHNGKLYRSFPRLYLEIADPTEYQVANSLFAGWPHWQRLMKNARIAAVIEELRDELEVKLRSEGIRKVINAATTKGSEPAAKWLADRGWATNGAGRPSKKQVQAELKRQAKIEKLVEDDAKRLQEFINK